MRQICELLVPAGLAALIGAGPSFGASVGGLPVGGASAGGVGVHASGVAESAKGVEPPKGVTLQTGDGTLVVSQPSVDLGVHSDTHPILHAFTVTNASSRRVRLELSFCHFCTPPELGKAELDAGESTSLLMEIDPSGRTGEVRANATITAAGLPASAVMVGVKADIQPRVWVEPLQFFPRVVRGEATSLRAVVTGRSAGFAVTKVESDHPSVSASARPARERAQPGGGKVYDCELDILLPAEMALGRFAARLTVHTNDAEAQSKYITIDGEAVGRVSAQPSRVGVRVTTGAVFGATFEIATADRRTPLVIEQVDVLARDEAGSVALDVVPGPDPSMMYVLVSGTAPMRDRAASDLGVVVIARAGPNGEAESITLPITLVVQLPQ